MFLQHNLPDEGPDMPVSLRCSTERLQEDGVYLLGKKNIQ